MLDNDQVDDIVRSHEEAEEVGTSHETALGRTFEEVARARFARRSFLKGSLAAAPLFVVKPQEMLGALASTEAAGTDTLTFTPISPRPADEDSFVVPEGYVSNVVIRWGDPMTADAPEFDVMNQTRESQDVQFGFNCDYVGFFPLGPVTSRVARQVGTGLAAGAGYAVEIDTDQALLVVNHEYTNPIQMFPNYVPGNPTKNEVDVELSAHGAAVVEIRRNAEGTWNYVQNSPFNRRITGFTPMVLTGPAVGHPWLQTAADPTGVTVEGMLNNCAAGKTPWGTVLTCEENFNQYFANNNLLADGDERKSVNSRYGIPGGSSPRRWENHYDRFDLTKEPNENFRFGWIVEIDPYDPTFVPRKHTSMGRFKHEGATTTLAPTGQVVVYTGDDEVFDYVYKFVTAGRYNGSDRKANFDLLDEGTLYVARFDDDGSGEWIPLVYGEGPLTEINGFTSQADVLIKTRLAGDVVGATRMDRPEDIEPNPRTGTVYVTLTNNTRRSASQVNASNPRGPNRYGHIIELNETDGDATSTTFSWNIFMLCGNPADASHGTFFAGFDKPELVSPISSPDNIVFDGDGNLWIGTDGQPGTLGANDALHAVPTSGPNRGYLRQFLSVPAGAENCGPEFSLDYKSVFSAVQHPGEGGTFENPISNFPDGMQPARPSVCSVARRDGGKIGR